MHTSFVSLSYEVIVGADATIAYRAERVLEIWMGLMHLTDRKGGNRIRKDRGDTYGERGLERPHGVSV